MTKSSVLILFLLGVTLGGYAQFSDDFSDGDFTENPPWFGDTGFFSVENNQLRLTAPSESQEAQLVTLSQALITASWEFALEMTFQPSGNNFAKVYLLSDNSQLNAPLNGYYLEIGATNRAVRLMRQNGTTTATVVEGIENRLASNPVQLSVRVTRDAVGFWEVYTDTTGGTAYVLEGNGFDDTNLHGDYFGVYCRYTPTRADRFYFDNFVVTGDPFTDNEPPKVVDLVPISANELTVTCDKNVQLSSITTLTNFEVNENIGNPIASERNPTNAREFTLTFDASFEIGKVYTLSTQQLLNYSNVASAKQYVDFQYIVAQEAEYGDIIINEFMARSNPTVGLPDRQYVEVYNRSDKFIHLKDWKLSDRTSTGTVQDVWIYPDSIVLLVPTAGLTDYPSATNVTNWPNLNTTGDDIALHTPEGTLIDFIQYTNEWYQDDAKSNGGFSIERINPLFNCSDATNWKASHSPLGGTPGAPNSVLAIFEDESLPQLETARVISPTTIQLSFSKGLQPDYVDVSAIDIAPVMPIDSIHFVGNYPTDLTLYLSTDLERNKQYTLTWENVVCCNENTSTITATFILTDSAIVGDVIINEILHHPLTGGSDFIELYNTSSKYIDLYDWSLGNHGDDGVANERFIPFHYILEPSDYVVITRDSSFLKVNYPFATTGKYIQLPSLPTYTNDGSTVYLVQDEQIMDKVAYTRDWHFQLLQSTRGVSLERFDPNGPSNDPNNWHSASETVGFATPGTTNSQKRTIKASGTLHLSSPSFSPDNDGFEDVLLITYQLTAPEMLGSITIFDDKGRKTRTLVTNELLGTSGTLKWDGVDDRGNKAHIGPYIILFEALDLQSGDSVLLRKVVTVAGRL